MAYPVYDAPHLSPDGHSLSRRYAVRFRPHHTLYKHLASLQRNPAVLRELPRKFDREMETGYIAELVERDCLAIRLDPGVESVTESAAALGGDGQLYQARYIRSDGGPWDYSVILHPGHTLAKYLDFLGRDDFSHHGIPTSNAYSGDFDDDTRDAIRRDRGVKYVADIPLGEDESKSDESRSFGLFD